MKQFIFALLSLVILSTACKKDIKHCIDLLPQRQHWTKYSGNPVFEASIKYWDDGIILGHSVIKSGSTYRMWYAGGHSIENATSIGYATSNDGINWTRYSGNPVFEGMP